MDRVAGSALYGPLVRIETPMDLAAAEAIDDPGILLVYAVIPRRHLLQRIWGWGIEERLRLREGSRLTHGRGWDG